MPCRDDELLERDAKRDIGKELLGAIRDVKAGRHGARSVILTKARMHKPPHPGAILQDTVLNAITVSEFARRLKISRSALSRVVNGRTAVSAGLALRLAAALGGSAESWLRMQMAYDLWQAGKKRRPKINSIKLAA